MKRILVFDFGVGGEYVADYIEQELCVVEVVRLIDWQNSECDQIFPAEIRRLVERKVQPYIGRFDLIVLGGYVSSLALFSLQEAFPEQAFVGMGVDCPELSRVASRTGRVIALMNPTLNESLWHDDFLREMFDIDVITPNCGGWEQMINENSMTPDILRADLAEIIDPNHYRSLMVNRINRPHLSLAEQISILQTSPKESRTAAENYLRLTEVAKNGLSSFTFAQNLSAHATQTVARKTPISSATIFGRTPPRTQPEIYAILDTHFWGIRRELREATGRQAKLVDFRQKLLHDVCSALKLRGVHGGR